MNPADGGDRIDAHSSAVVRATRAVAITGGFVEVAAATVDPAVRSALWNRLRCPNSPGHERTIAEPLSRRNAIRAVFHRYPGPLGRVGGLLHGVGRLQGKGTLSCGRQS